jgi:hypothetical protein
MKKAVVESGEINGKTYIYYHKNLTVGEISIFSRALTEGIVEKAKFF